MMPMGTTGMPTADAASASASEAQGTDTKSSASAPAPPAKQSRRSAEESENLADIEIGTLILVKYAHPSLGRIKYEGVLAEKELDGTNHDSFIQLKDCKQL